MVSLKLYASYYYSIGMNVVPIYGTSGNCDFKIPHKETFEKWRNIRQDFETVNTIDWQSASGVGFITGVNNLRVIDIDKINCHNYENSYNPYTKDLNVDFLPEMLEQLGLPKDYQWVIKTGSKRGLHIIIETEDIPNVKANVFPVDSFSISNRIDVLWHLFSVLPPSLHQSGNTYSFYHNELPKYKPYKVNIERLYKMLLNYSGCCKPEKFTASRINLDFDLFYKVCQISNYCSGFDEVYTSRASIEFCHEFLEHTISGLNNLGVNYISRDFNKAINYFTKCNNEYSKLNLTILKSLGLIESTFEEVNSDVAELKTNNSSFAS